MSGKSFKLLRQEAEKRGVPYRLVKRAFKRLNTHDRAVLIANSKRS